MKTATCLVAAVGIVFAFQGVPRAEDYKVAASENFSGKPAAPVFQTAGQKKFRTMISEAAAKGPNFAGHYRIAEWGCGGECVQFAVVDSRSGAIYDGPFGVLPAGYVSLSADAPADVMPLTYQTGSSLLVVNGCPNEKDCATYYYQWKGTQFSLLRKEAAGRR